MGTGIRDILRMVSSGESVGNMAACHNTVVVVGMVHYRHQPSVRPAAVVAYGMTLVAGSSGRNIDQGNMADHIAAVPVDAARGNVDGIWRVCALRQHSSL